MEELYAPNGPQILQPIHRFAVEVSGQVGHREDLPLRRLEFLVTVFVFMFTLEI